ncbi:MAG: tRNA pseudouridine(55) synthase TruB [Candidatus Eiseniibacteriota bacterium]|jgi:tRNA pseudouridine55 synthase
MSDRVLLVDKVSGPTSHDVVDALRRALGVRRIGHAGTLDPFATGLLVCCVGGATRLTPYLSDLDKEYVGRVRLGVETDSLDPTGEVVRRSPLASGWREALPVAIAALTGWIDQVPPMTSAVRVGGRRLYELAHAGSAEIDRPARRVRVDAIDIEAIEGHDVVVRVRCGKGTYVRTLAAELGRRLGTCAHLASLRRTRVGPLGVDRALPSDRVARPAGPGELEAATIAPADALGDWPRLVLDETAAARLRHGVAPPLEAVAADRSVRTGDRVCLVGRNGELLALGEALDDLEPHRTGAASARPGAGAAVRLLRVLAAPPGGGTA